MPHNESPLPQTLNELARTHGGAVARAIPISTLPTHLKNRNRTFRLEFENGRILKGRSGVPQHVIVRIRYILARLPQRHFTQIVASDGDCLLEEWAEGTPLNGSPESPDVCKLSGRLLGAIHSTVVKAPSQGRLRTDRYINWIKASLLHLIFRGLINRHQAESTMNRILTMLPEYTEYGVTHRDFSPDNLIRRNGELISIDNLMLNHQAFHEDLARTWYVWGCRDVPFQFFLEGYSEYRPIAPFLNEQRFWKSLVLLRAADARSEIDSTSAAGALIRQLDETLFNRLSHSSLTA